ncbi:MAG: hypothetical protein GXY14_06510 [Spirochaetes bacterium]|nr:hypothetical protein [Spirochaetota bacterium]
MKIYHISSDCEAENRNIYAEFSGLKKAAGCECLARFTIDEKTEYDRLKELALLHINDPGPVLENIMEDHDFLKAEKYMLINELVVRVLPVTRSTKPGCRINSSSVKLHNTDTVKIRG